MPRKPPTTPTPPESEGKIVPRNISSEMKESYLDYAMSVITSRALPDVRDGLKPVHRRILYTMLQSGLTHAAKFKKSATVVGAVLGSYHPHGDTSVYDAMVKMAQDFNYRYPLVEGQGNFGCFTKDTKVKLTDGRGISFGDLMREQKAGKRHWTFSFNTKDKKIEVAEIHNPRKTRNNAQLVEVELDTGEKIRCTPNHRFMLRNGSYRAAEKLKVGDSLMPLYAQLENNNTNTHLNGYEKIFQPDTKSWEFTHHLADAWNVANRVYKRSAGRVRHHIDFNKRNNNPDNIQRMQWGDHWRLHASLASWRHENDPDYVRKLAEGRIRFIKENHELLSERASKRNKKMWQDPAYRAKRITAVRELWQNKEYKEFMRRNSSATLQRLWKQKDFQLLMSDTKSKELKERWQDPEYRAKMQKHMQDISQRIWSDPAHRAYISRIMSERMNDPTQKARQSRISKDLWDDPEYRAKYPKNHFQKMAQVLWERPETRTMHSAKAKKQWEDAAFRKKVIQTIKANSRRRLENDPECMQKLNKKAVVSLKKNWQDPEYKKRVIRSKILGFASSVLSKHKEITPELYNAERYNNGIPNAKTAIRYFGSFTLLRQEAETHNHKVVGVRALKAREDVYDITVDPWHNFSLGAGIFVHNSNDGDQAAAYRYTEAKMSRLAGELLRDLEKETVDWRPNYDGTKREPVYLPATVPNVLLNGTLGIAVGMATNIPPHNLRELVDATVYLIDNKNATTEELLQFVHGPDFPTGGLCFGAKDIAHAYASGRGGVVCRGEAEIVEVKGGSMQIVITSLPYRVNKAEFIIKIADLVKNKKIDGIKALRDESARGENRVVIDLKSTGQPQKVLNYLYKHTDLETTFHYNILALVDGVPQTLSLKAILGEFITHRELVVKRRSEFDLRKAKEREHILLGLKKALDNIDKVIKTIKGSRDVPTAHANLMKVFRFSKEQATAILEMRLQKLANLERKQVEDELKEKQKLIKELQILLASQAKIRGVIKKELAEIGEKYGDERKTKVVKGGIKALSVEDIIPDEENVLVLTRSGYIKRTNPAEYRRQKRGGVGVTDLSTKEEDFVTRFLTASTHAGILFFTNKGKAYQTRMYEIPEGKRATRGKSVMNFLPLTQGEYITSVLAVPKSAREVDKLSLLMVTARGMIKRVSAKSFMDVRRSGILAIKLKSGDILLEALLVEKGDEVVLVTAKGQAIRFKASQIREMGRGAAGVRAMKLGKDDEIISADYIDKESRGAELLVMSERGFGKKTPLKEYKVQARGGSGIKTAKVTDKTGKLVGAKIVTDEYEEILAISKQGHVIRTALKEIPRSGRQTQGVRIMRLRASDAVATFICL